MRSRGQSSEVPETKRKLVDAGVKLMRTKGFNATTVDDICSAAGVTKGGFFHYFKSKEEIAKAAVLHFSEGKRQDFQEASFHKVADSLERIHARLDYVKESVGNNGRLTKGCLIGVVGQEVSFTHPELRAACQESFSRMVDDFAKDLEQAKAAHPPKIDFDPASLAMQYVAIFQGSAMIAKAAESNAVLLNNIEHFRSYLELLFGLPRLASVAKTTTAASEA